MWEKEERNNEIMAILEAIVRNEFVFIFIF